MARAGFYAVEGAKIRFGRDGYWYGDDERIANPRIADLFSRCLRREPDGSYAIRMVEERAVVEIEDTPWVVTSIENDAHGTLLLVLNDGTREPLDPTTLVVGRDEVLYCRAKMGEERVRFLRAAYYQLALHFAEDNAGEVGLVLNGARYPIRSDRGA